MIADTLLTHFKKIKAGIEVFDETMSKEYTSHIELEYAKMKLASAKKIILEQILETKIILRKFK